MTADIRQTIEGSADGIRWSLADSIGRITLDRPEKANTIGVPQGAAFARAVDEVLAGAPRVVLLTGTGRIFCAGGDLDAMTRPGVQTDQEVGRILEPFHPAVERLSRAPIPVVCALNGAVGGAGVGLALCGDTVISTASMKLRTGYSAIALSPDAGASYFLARRIGSERAKQLFFYSEPIDSARCLAMGIVDEVHDDAHFAAATEALVARLASAATGSMARIKQLCEGIAARSLHDHLALERRLLQEASRQPDAAEGIRAFLEKRPPRFTGH
ncbi:MAG TPA: enoyl-CoA hydratase-related protein [Burkholderiaceae bacterium]|nr:enoyl-CoA hydratase-related protein [Burkholderiaceae bacterium]